MSIPMLRPMHVILLFSLVAPAFGATSILSIEPTQMQSKITVQTDQAGFCTYRASRGSAFTTNIPDLLDNGNTDARTGSILNAGKHVFILGTRKANDALAPAATYWIGVTCGSDSEVSTTFATQSIQWGNTAPDIVPFNAANFGNMDHARIDWNATAAANTFCDPSTYSYCDPTTGVEYWVVTHPAWSHIKGMNPAAANAGAMNTPIDLSAAKWSTPANAKTNGASFSVGSGGPTDKLFIPLANFNSPTGGGPMSGWGNTINIDDISYDVFCGSASTDNVTPLNLQLTIDGGQTGVGNVITTSNCRSAAPVKLGTYPNAGDPAQLVAQPVFKGWGYIPQRNLIQPPAGTVSVSGSAVTLSTASPTWANWFIHDWPAGSPILINGSYAHLASSPATGTDLTIQENLGTLTNVPYSGANFGVIVTKANASSANVSVSLGINYAQSDFPSACCNGDLEMINLASVSVTKSANGTTCGIYTVGCSSGTLNPPLTGYIGYLLSGSSNSALMLWIPFNSDGSPRAETRLLSALSKPNGSARVNANGDTVGSVNLSNALFFDNEDGTSAYAVDQGNKRVWKLSYNEAYSGCAGYVSYHPYLSIGDYPNTISSGPPADDCFTWTVLTPLAGGHDIYSQIVSGYQTGLNYLGQIVGPAHPGFDLGWMTNLRTPPAADGDLFSVALDNGQNELAVLGSFDAVTGVLKSVRNMWDSGGARWAGSHACPIFDMGTYRFCVLDPLENMGTTNRVFNNRNQATLSQVNRAGFGSAPAWDSNTSLSSNTNFYVCPSGLPAPYESLSGTTNCIQVRVNTPFCQVTPNSTYTFPDGKTEKDEFPCTTPGFGIANASYSKLQDIQVGDWLSSSDGNENFVVATAPVYNSATDITFWVLRTMGWNFDFPIYGAFDETDGAGHTIAGLSCCTHANGWYLWAVPFGHGNSVAIDVSSPDNTWLFDNPVRLSGHGSAGAGSIAGTFNYAQAGYYCGNSAYCGSTNLTPAQMVNSRFVSLASQSPTFGGLSSSLISQYTQSYANATQGPAVSAFPFYVDFRHINPSYGGGQEFNSTFGNSFTTTLVGGTARTYLISADCCTASPDYKRWGLQAYAGRFWLKDISSPATFAGVADMANWSVCRVRNANECVFGSTPGQYYVTIPKHDLQSQCASNLFDLAIPCVTSFGPWSGQTVQFRVDRFDAAGLTTRKFGFAHNHPGLAYQFSNCRLEPSGQFMFCPGYWLDGVRTEWLALRIGALPRLDSVNRTTFVPISLTYQGVPFASNIRARFGYAENGGDLLWCTAYGQDCSTEIPSGSPNDPFSFTNEAVTRQACANGATCTITIPSLPNRILYYVMDRLDSSGTVIGTSPLQAVVVP